AMFHEIYGFNVLAAWIKFPDSYALQVIGKKVYMKIDGRNKLMKDMRFRSEEQVDKIIRSLAMQKEDAILNTYNNSLEVDLYTGERIAILISPRVKQNVITFRRFLIDAVRVEDLTIPKRKTLPIEGVNVVKGLSKTHCNIIIAGPTGVGKSTLTKAMLAERDPGYTGVIM
ncbi:ATPase, T2SS/T4P/T4SS family, partial [Streptomyces globisporus]